MQLKWPPGQNYNQNFEQKRHRNHDVGIFQLWSRTFRLLCEIIFSRSDDFTGAQWHKVLENLL